MKLRLLTETEKFLKHKQKPMVDDPSIYKELVDEMFELMDEHHGIGLAANQVGVELNLFIMKINGIKYVVFNPTILDSSNTQHTAIEGCLSYPKLKLKISRAEEISVQYMDIAGIIITETLSGLHARCFLHENDHLKGITFINKVPKRTLLQARINSFKS